MSGPEADGSPPEIVIRPATANDAEAMVDLELASAIHHASVDPKRWRVPPRDAIAAYRRVRQQADPDGASIVAVAEGHVIGMVEMLLRGSSDPGAARVPVRSVDVGISVAPEWRGRGVGSTLMLAAQDWAREQDAGRVILDVAATNSGALRLYQRLGYEVHGYLMDRDLDAGPPAGAGEPGPESSARSDDRPRLDRGGKPIPTLDGELVRLRPLLPGDRAALVEALSDPSVAEVWDSRGAQVSADELLLDDEVTAFAIEVDGELAGSIQYAEEDDPAYRHAGIDVFLHSRFQGRGLGTDAVRTLARYLFEVRAHHRLTIDPAASNARAIRTYENVGFRRVGVMRRYERGGDGTFHDGLLMDMLADELR